MGGTKVGPALDQLSPHGSSRKRTPNLFGRIRIFIGDDHFFPTPIFVNFITNNGTRNHQGISRALVINQPIATVPNF